MSRLGCDLAQGIPRDGYQCSECDCVFELPNCIHYWCKVCSDYNLCVPCARSFRHFHVLKKITSIQFECDNCEMELDVDSIEKCPRCKFRPYKLRQPKQKNHLRIPQSHDIEEVRDKFLAQWTKGTNTHIRVHRVFAIVNTNTQLKKAYKRYKKSLQQPYEVQHLYHGTSACELKTDRCENQSCSTCCISKEGFKISLAQTNLSWGRYGKGIYFAQHSSKGHDYNARSETTSGTRAIVVSSVLLGNPYRTQHDMSTLTAPPHGYHSVVGVVGPRLNYPEVVVYRNDAVLPRYIIIYSAHANNRRGTKAVPGQDGRYYCGGRFTFGGSCDFEYGDNCSDCKWLDRQ
eukprot:TRINITY_DN173_c0_g1_i1.p1 TRINITY_DN173_c0_g1~~TRINITY_DN173_c0_g1_i1.p1  ORF type:complete len:345 (+),score=26.71 TRINITY_DN173_c0_g1_i1:90-1124(+)